MRKTVFITGSSRGIGLGIAEKFAQNDYNVVINANKSITELFEAETHLKKYHNNILSVPADVSDYGDCQSGIEKINSVFGGVDILVNNAGVSLWSPFNCTNPNQWDFVMHNNLHSVLNCCRLCMDYMINKKDGAIINISSIWGTSGASCEAVYSASKGAVNSFTKALAKELGQSGITVNAIACGVIDTAMNNNLSTEEKNALKEEIPLTRFGNISEVADIAYAVANNKYITGQIITIDGGLTI